MTDLDRLADAVGHDPGCATMKRTSEHGYGLCPVCRAPGVNAERSPNGKTTCANGHSYPHRDRVMELAPQGPCSCEARDTARRVVEAMRKPSEGMVTAAGQINNTDKAGNTHNYRRRKRAYWQAMCDHILKEPADV